MPDQDEIKTEFYFEGDAAQAVRADLTEWGADPTVKIKLRRKSGHDGWFIQVCTDSWGGDDNNNSVACPGRPGC